jgi:hypothetical protein
MSVNIYQTTRYNIPEDSHLHATEMYKSPGNDQEMTESRDEILCSEIHKLIYF